MSPACCLFQVTATLKPHLSVINFRRLEEGEEEEAFGTNLEDTLQWVTTAQGRIQVRTWMVMLR